MLELRDSGAFFEAQGDRLVILDEIHHAPDVFKVLHGVIDSNRRQGDFSPSRWIICAQEGKHLFCKSFH